MTTQIILEGQPPKYLTAPSYKLGRAADCDVLLPENDNMVSRYHARVERGAEGQWWIVDSSTNGTFVNGFKLTGRQALRHGDQIGIGRSQIGFVSPPPAASGPPPFSPAPSGPAARGTETVFVTREDLNPKAAAPASAPAAIPQAAEAPQSREIGPPPVAAAAVPIQPPSYAASPPPQEASSLHAGGVMKQCTRCRSVYSQDEEACPSCGHAGFKIKNSASPTMAAAPGAGGEETPFDRAVQQPVSPPGVPVGASRDAGPARSVPPQTVAPASAGAGTGAAVASGAMGVIAAGCGLAMLFSMFLPWAQVQVFFVSGSVSYADMCQLVLKAFSESSAMTMKAIEEEPSLLFGVLPPVAVLVTLAGGAMGLTGIAGKLPSAARNLSTGVVLGIGGAAGLAPVALLLLNAGKYSSDVAHFLGAGFWLFTLASLVAAIAGFGGGAIGAALAGSSAGKRR